MTASTSPDDNSYLSKETGSHEHTDFVYDEPNTPEAAESSYVPEREFVLMPLFRRIGELLGIRKHQEPEYIYESTPERQEEGVRPSEHIADFAQPQAALSHQEPFPAPEPVQDLKPHWEPEPEPLPEVEPNVPEPVALQGFVHEPETHPAPPTVPEEVAAESASFEPTYELEPTQHFEMPVEASAPETLPQIVEAEAPAAPLQAKRQRAPRAPDEIDEAIAILREAGSKISTAISQTVEWLSAKEAQLMRQAELALSPSPKRRRVPANTRVTPSQPPQLPERVPVTMAAIVEPEIAAEASSVTKSEPLQFPGLQREVAWQEPTERMPERPQPAALPVYSAPPRPALVQRRPRVPFWKGIDWAAEFTPKRVAVLGGAVMAMLIIGGITFARRPASDVLPPQARKIQPGGVTLTTHPTAAATAPVPQQHRTAPPAKHAVAPATHRAQRTAVYDEPDVVTHYYKQKPSPAKQSTVAGVKHYSDME